MDGRAAPDRARLLAEFGGRVRDARSRLGVSQEELADRAGLDRTYVSGVERGRRNVALVNILRLAAALEMDPGELVAGIKTARHQPK